MDPISQGILGAVAVQNVARKKHFVLCTIIGLLAAMASDLDVLISSSTDPLLSIEYHRQFTHSLVFIPFGGLIVATALYWLFAKRWLDFRSVYIFSTLGYATHPFLDATTSYGTQLFWPFSDARIAVSNMPIVDPFFTLPIIALVIVCAVKRNPFWARIAVIWIAFYLTLGMVQKHRAESVGYELALSRGHVPQHLSAKPSVGKLLLWKSIYETDGVFYIDGVRTGLTGSRVYPGDSIERVNVPRDFPWLDLDSTQAKDIERFRWFSDGFIAVHPNDPKRIIDARYSFLPNEIDALWMIELDRNADADQHIKYVHEHEFPEGQAQLFFDMLLNR